MDNLPQSWEIVKLRDVVTPSKEKIEPLTHPTLKYIGLEHIESHSRKILGSGISGETKSTKTVFHSGDILYGKLRPYLNKVCIARFDGVCSTDILVFNKGEKIESKYLALFLFSKPVVDYTTHHSTGVQLPRISFEKLGALPIPLPPLPEQQRIVIQVEKLLARVEATRERLNRVPTIMQQFRQSVLAAACSGRLTEEWRRSHQNHSSAKEIIKFASSNRDIFYTSLGFKNQKKKPSEISILDQSIEQKNIQETWCWIKLPDVGYLSRGRSKNRPRNDPILYGGDYPFIQTGDISQSNGRILSHTQTYNEMGLRQSQLWGKDTICITIAANIAESAILTYPACFPDSVVGIITNNAFCLPEYVEYYIRTIKSDLSQYAPATAQKNINVAILSEVQIPIPPLEEQKELIRQVNALFCHTSRIEAQVVAARERVETITQSILHQAFTGRLIQNEETVSLI